MDGPAAQLGRPLYRTTQAYVNALNARGGINGRRVELFLQTACINCDDENRLAAKALVEQKRVFAIVNTYMNTYAFSSALGYVNIASQYRLGGVARWPAQIEDVKAAIRWTRAFR